MHTKMDYFIVALKSDVSTETHLYVCYIIHIFVTHKHVSYESAI